MLDLYRNIKEVRTARMMTQSQLAELTGYSDKSMIAKIEKGQIDLPQSKIELFAKVLGVSPSALMGWDGVAPSRPRKVIPVLGRVAAGIPIGMVEDIVDEEEIPEDWQGDYFGLLIHGDSMEPKISDGDIVIVKKQDDVENGQVGIVTINGDDATCKRIYKYAETLVLMSINPKYPPMEYKREDAENLPIRILGRVVESRSKF